MNKQRRTFLTITAASTAIIGTSATMLKAQELELDQVNDKVTFDISANHGHSVDLDLKQVVLLYQSASQDPLLQTKVSIQGTSSHPHQILLKVEDINSLLLGEEVSVESSSDFGHIHNVNLNLNLLIEET